MAIVVDYDYLPELSTQDALHNLTSDVTTWYDTEIPWVNTYKINAEVSTYNYPEWWEWGIAGWSTNINRYSSAYNIIAWGSWYVYLPDWTSISVSSWSANLSATTYIYVDQSNWSVYATTTASDAVWDNKILLCVAAPTESWKSCSFQAFGTNKQSTFITADNVAANVITWNELIWNTITGRTIRTASSWERFVMSSSEVAQYDSNWRLRVEYMGNGITFYDTSWYVWASIYWSNGKITIDSSLSTSNIDAYSTTTNNLSVSDSATLEYVTIGSSWRIDCRWEAEFSWKLRIPVGIDLY